MLMDSVMLLPRNHNHVFARRAFFARRRYSTSVSIGEDNCVFLSSNFSKVIAMILVNKYFYLEWFDIKVIICHQLTRGQQPR
jgi:hypothetical protein